ncbi:hypothetical protein EB796_015930 [Bugula neritina]|uniref:Uncharacterized protein n=1 Tax=Bugula neritina TaxID=10212 RepID=A0A7J7JH67_BUGNE|nr:hypothetical protein EB796_015930 [Bugula neritina]
MEDILGVFNCSPAGYIRWKILIYFVQFVSSTVDVVTECIALVKFSGKVMGNDPYNRTDTMAGIHTWTAGCVVQALLCISQLALFIRSLHKLGCHQRAANYNSQSAERIYSKWSQVNFLLGYIFEDCMIGLTKLVIALFSEDALKLLQQDFERIASIVSFTVTSLQFIITTLNAAMMFRRSTWCSGTHWYVVACLFFSSSALVATGLAMGVSLSITSVHITVPVLVLVTPTVFLFLVGLLCWDSCRNGTSTTV